MGGVGRLHVRRRRSGRARRQAARRVPRRILGVPVVRLVDPGADRRGERSRIVPRSSRCWRRALHERLGAPDLAVARAAAEEEVAFAASLCDHPARHLDRGAPHLRGRRDPRSFPHLAPARDRKPMRAFSFLEVEGEEEAAGETIEPCRSRRTRSKRTSEQLHSTFTFASLDHLAPFLRLRARCARRNPPASSRSKDEVRREEVCRESRVVEDALVLRIELVDDRRAACPWAPPSRTTSRPGSRADRSPPRSARPDIAEAARVLPKPSTLSWPACHGCATSPMLTIIIWMWPPIGR